MSSSSLFEGDTLVENPQSLDSLPEVDEHVPGGLGDQWEALEPILDRDTNDPLAQQSEQNMEVLALAVDTLQLTMDDVATQWTASPNHLVVDFHLPATEFVTLLLKYNVVHNNSVLGGKNPSLQNWKGFVECSKTMDEPSRFLYRCSTYELTFIKAVFDLHMERHEFNKDGLYARVSDCGSDETFLAISVW
ncbi:hypothetical protein H2202_001971 [Exophiala xenobiotica]|nr:hypothetical protein H2202_001971 [Exophiala xenobiotica]